jgi:tight adherence protein B
VLVPIAILVFVVVALGAFAIFSLIDERSARTRILRERLSSVEQAAERNPTEELALLRDELLSEIPAFDSLMRRSERVFALQKLLTQADIKTRAGNFLMLSAASALAVATVSSWTNGRAPILIWAGLIAGYFMPYVYASYRRTKRFRRFEDLFPEAIDKLARSVRAGHTFTKALEMMSTEVSEPVAGEIRKLYEEQKFGLPVRDALMNLADRVPIVDVKFFVTAVMIQRETGGNLAEILDNLSYVIRERRKIHRRQ